MKSHGDHRENTSIQNTKHTGWLKTLRHTPENTYLLNWSPTNQPTTNRPQLSHCEHFASMEVGRARRRRRQRGVGHGWRGYARNNISDYIRSTLVDHVINHGLTMREAGQRVHPHLSRFTVASIIRTFRLENRYVFSSLRQTVSTVFTVLYHMTANHVSSCLVDFFNSNCSLLFF